MATGVSSGGVGEESRVMRRLWADDCRYSEGTPACEICDRWFHTECQLVSDDCDDTYKSAKKSGITLAM
jgi:hypothetical protein